MPNNSQFRAAARAKLGNKIFGELWLCALLAFLVFGIITGVTSFVAILVIGPLTYGLTKIFIEDVYAGKKAEIGKVFDGFTKTFTDSLLLGILIDVFTFLWALLFIIPGIVKSYSYSMAYYIKLDHPEYTALECITASKNLMKGKKWQLFCLDFSFIGWFLLGALCFGIGTLWVLPYNQAAHSEFYRSISGEVVKPVK